MSDITSSFAPLLFQPFLAFVKLFRVRAESPAAAITICYKLLISTIPYTVRLNKFLLRTNRYMPSNDNPIPSPSLMHLFPYSLPPILLSPHLLLPSCHLHEATLPTATLQLQVDASETTLLSLVSPCGHLLTPSSLLHNSPASASLSCHTILPRPPPDYCYNIPPW